jgi:hypothetical protein
MFIFSQTCVHCLDQRHTRTPSAIIRKTHGCALCLETHYSWGQIMPSSHLTLRNKTRDVQAARQWYEKELARQQATRATAAAPLSSVAAAGQLTRRHATPQQKAEAWFQRTYGDCEPNHCAPSPARSASVARNNNSRGSSPLSPFIATPRRMDHAAFESARAYEDDEMYEQDVATYENQADTGGSSECWGGLVRWAVVLAILLLSLFLAVVGSAVDHDDATNGANVHLASVASGRTTKQHPVDLAWGAAAAAPQIQTGVNSGVGAAMARNLTAARNEDCNFHDADGTCECDAVVGNVTQWVEEKVYFVKKTLVAWSIDRTCSAAPWQHSNLVDETTGTRHLFSAADVARDVLLDDDDTLWTMIRNAPEYNQVFVWRSISDGNNESQLLIGLHPSLLFKVPWPCRVQNGFQHFVLFALRLLWDLCRGVTFPVVFAMQTFPMATIGVAAATGIVRYGYQQVQSRQKYHALYQ